MLLSVSQRIIKDVKHLVFFRKIIIIVYTSFPQINILQLKKVKFLLFVNSLASGTLFDFLILLSLIKCYGMLVTWHTCTSQASVRAQNPVSTLNSNASSLPPLHLRSLRDIKHTGKYLFIIRHTNKIKISRGDIKSITNLFLNFVIR